MVSFRTLKKKLSTMLFKTKFWCNSLIFLKHDRLKISKIRFNHGRFCSYKIYDTQHFSALSQQTPPWIYGVDFNFPQVSSLLVSRRRRRRNASRGQRVVDNLWQDGLPASRWRGRTRKRGPGPGSCVCALWILRRPYFSCSRSVPTTSLLGQNVVKGVSVRVWVLNR